MSSDAIVERSRAPSRAVSVIAGYFNITAVLNGVALLTTLTLAYSGLKTFAALRTISPLRTVSLLVGAAMYFRVGQLLHARRREGGYWAAAAFGLSLVSTLTRHPARLSSVGTLISLVGLGLVAFIWKELE